MKSVTTIQNKSSGSSFCQINPFNPIRRARDSIAKLLIIPSISNLFAKTLAKQAEYFYDSNDKKLRKLNFIDLTEKWVKNTKNAELKKDLLLSQGGSCDALIIRNPKNPPSSQWVVYFPGNASMWEYSLSEMATLSNTLGVNIIRANYQGSYHTKGSCSNKENLISNGIDLINYLKNQENVDLSKVCIIGESLGGAVGANVAAKFQKPGQEITYIGSNTFYDLSKVAAYQHILFVKEEKKTVKEYRNQLLQEKGARLFVFSIIHLAVEIIDLVARTGFFTASTISDLLHLRPVHFIKDIFELGKIAVISPFMILLATINLFISPCSNKLSRAQYTLLNKLIPEENTTAVRFLNSHFIHNLRKSLIDSSAWNLQISTETLEKIHKKHIFYNQFDEMMPSSSFLDSPKSISLADIVDKERCSLIKDILGHNFFPLDNIKAIFESMNENAAAM